MVESEDKELPLMIAKFFDYKDPSDSKYVSNFCKYINDFIELAKKSRRSKKLHKRNWRF